MIHLQIYRADPTLMLLGIECFERMLLGCWATVPRERALLTTGNVKGE